LLFDLVSEGNRALEAGQREQAGAARAVFLELAGVLGYRFEASDAAGGELVAALVPMLLDVREQARARRDFAQSDAIRDALNALGVTVEDSPAGPRWHLQRPTAPARDAPAPASDASA
ncbi:MAG TPA: hypothetical protein VML96_09200, partial [Egibacteraceae bacterium]|nr:hypothetical protein [Egibacteraceae bacterium]